MALTFTRVAVPASAPAFLAAVPPGPSQLVVTVTGGTLYLGAGTAVTATNGVPVTSYPWAITSYRTSSASPLYGIAAAGSTVATGVTISTPD